MPYYDKQTNRLTFYQPEYVWLLVAEFGGPSVAIRLGATCKALAKVMNVLQTLFTLLLFLLMHSEPMAVEDILRDRVGKG